MKERLNASIQQQDSQAGKFENYYARLNAAVDYVTVRDLGGRAYEEQDKLESGKYLFAKKDGDKFWELYRELKDKFFDAHKEARAKAVQEVEELIPTCSTVTEVRMLKREIFQVPVLDVREITKPLYEACDSRILELEKQSA